MKTFLFSLSLFVLSLLMAGQARAQEPFIGEVRLFAGDFPPRGWAFCDGQLVSISQNSALFAILGITYGGDGETTFGLPDLRGRVPVHAGGSPTGISGAAPVSLGEKAGQQQIQPDPTPPTPPAHPNVRKKNVKTLQGRGRRKSNIVSAPVPPVEAPTPATPGTAQDNRQPYLGMHYIIALVGTFPTEN